MRPSWVRKDVFATKKLKYEGVKNINLVTRWTEPMEGEIERFWGEI